MTYLLPTDATERRALVLALGLVALGAAVVGAIAGRGWRGAAEDERRRR